MNRLGIPPSEIPAFARALADCPHLRLAGTFTHIASSEVFTTEQTIEQEKTFDAALACMRSLGLDPGIVHMANSAAIVSRPSTWRDMVRPGAILYGYHQFFEPSELNPEMEAKLSVRPVLSFRARIVSIKDLPPGSRVGYNARWTASSPSRVAVLAAGYADGLVRVLSNKGRVIVRGEIAPIIGTVSMDLTTADVTGIARRAWATSPRSTAPTAARRNPSPTSRRLPIRPARTALRAGKARPPLLFALTLPSTSHNRHLWRPFSSTDFSLWVSAENLGCGLRTLEACAVTDCHTVAKL